MYLKFVNSMASCIAKEMIPSEYQKVEYIYTNGSSYVVYERQMYASYIVCMEIAKTDAVTSEQGFFGAPGAELYFQNGNIYHWGDVQLISPANGSSISQNQKISVTASVVATNAIPDGLNIGQYSDVRYTFYGNIYNVKLYDSTMNIMRAHFVPCYRKSDNVVGLYDIIGGYFLSSNGSAQFVAGPNV